MLKQYSIKPSLKRLSPIWIKILNSCLTLADHTNQSPISFRIRHKLGKKGFLISEIDRFKNNIEPQSLKIFCYSWLIIFVSNLSLKNNTALEIIGKELYKSEEIIRSNNRRISSLFLINMHWLNSIKDTPET